jgi:SAM-dependent methyltransferase
MVNDESGRELPRKVNLGCGRDLRPGFLNVDLRGEPDVVCDFDKRPWPLPAAAFDHAVALDVIEHVADLTFFMEELHRILAPGGTAEITTPHFSCANSFIDPTHRHHLSYFSLDYFTDASKYSFYSSARFELVERILVFRPRLPDRWIGRLARRWPDVYEQRWAWMFPAWFLIFRLRAVK